MDNKKEIKRKTKKAPGKIGPGVVIAAFLAAAVVYGVMLYTEKAAMETEETISVPVAMGTIKKGQPLVTEGSGVNIGYKEIPVSCIPKDVAVLDEFVSSLEAACDISEGSPLTKQMTVKTDIYKKNLTNPVLIGFKAEDFFQTVGGTIKKGDKIHIYAEDEEGEMTLRWSDIYVANAFDASGEEIEAGEEGKSLRFNIYLNKNDVEEFYEKVESKSLRIALACK
jgi:hypothetical protein